MVPKWCKNLTHFLGNECWWQYAVMFAFLGFLLGWLVAGPGDGPGGIRKAMSALIPLVMRGQII